MRSASAPESGKPWHALWALCAAVVMIGLDTTVVNIAIPDIQKSLGSDLNNLVWVANVYAVCYSVPLLLTGRLGDRYGHKKVFQWGLLVFTMASVACAFAPSVQALITARAIQGLGAALMTPQTMALIVFMFTPERRGAALGVRAAAGTAALAAGPLIGGILTSLFGWRSIFLVNLVIGLFATVIVATMIRQERPTDRRPIALVPALLSGLGLAAIVLALDGLTDDWSTYGGLLSTPYLGAAGIALLAAFVTWQRARPQDTLVPFHLFANTAFTLSCLAAATVGAATIGILLPLMLYLQGGLSLSALQAAGVTVPMFVASALASLCSGRLSDGEHAKHITTFGLVVLTTGVVSLLLIVGPGLSAWALMPSLFLSGLGMGASAAPLARSALAAIPPGDAGIASGVYNFSRLVCGTIGAVTTGAIIQAFPEGQSAAGLRASVMFAAVLLTLATVFGTAIPKPARNTDREQGH